MKKEHIQLIQDTCNSLMEVTGQQHTHTHTHTHTTHQQRTPYVILSPHTSMSQLTKHAPGVTLTNYRTK